MRDDMTGRAIAAEETGGASSASGRPRIGALTSARFFAAIAVVLLHFDLYLDVHPLLFLVLSNGGVGVSFFFVLSGFIITYTYYEWFAAGVRAAEYLRFIQARFARIVPMHVVALLLMTPLTLYLVRTTAGNPGLAYGPGAIAGSWLANLLAVQVYVPLAFVEQMWNAPSWSIGCELFFYLAFPFVAARIARARVGQRELLGGSLALWAGAMGLTLAASLAIWYCPGLRLGSTLEDSATFVTSRMPFLRFPEFVIGCLAGTYFLRGGQGRLGAIIARERGRNVLLAGALAGVGLIMLAQVIVWEVAGTGYYEASLPGFLFMTMHTYLYMVPFAVVVLCLARGPGLLSPLLERGWLVLLGEASYSLYLVHWPVLTFLGGVLKVAGLAPDSPAATALALLAIGAAIGASVLLYRFVETPARRRLRSRAVLVQKKFPFVVVGPARPRRSA